METPGEISFFVYTRGAYPLILYLLELTFLEHDTDLFCEVL